MNKGNMAPTKSSNNQDWACIYVLSDPRNGVVRYVGKTNNPEVRLKTHWNSKVKTKTHSWITSCKRAGVKPIMDVIEVFSGPEYSVLWREAEIFWIAYFRFLGLPLTNLHPGGIGGYPLSPETLLKVRGRKRTPEQCARIGNASKGRVNSEECRRKISVALTGSKRSDEQKLNMVKAQQAFTPEQKAATAAKIGAAHAGKILSPETRRKISEANLGRKLSAETRKKQSERMKGYKPSEETIEKVRLANLGAKRSQAAREAMSKAAKLRCSKANKEKSTHE